MMKSLINTFGLPVACAGIGILTAISIVAPMLLVALIARNEVVMAFNVLAIGFLSLPWSLLLAWQNGNLDPLTLCIYAGFGVLFNGAFLGGICGVFFSLLTPYDAVENDLSDDDKNPYRLD